VVPPDEAVGPAGASTAAPLADLLTATPVPGVDAPAVPHPGSASAAASDTPSEAPGDAAASAPISAPTPAPTLSPATTPVDGGRAPGHSTESQTPSPFWATESTYLTPPNGSTPPGQATAFGALTRRGAGTQT
jgi:hypothetical protein